MKKNNSKHNLKYNIIKKIKDFEIKSKPPINISHK